MRVVVHRFVVAVAVAHGLIHLLGAVKGFGWAEVSELQEPIGGFTGGVWLVAAIAMVLAGVLLAVGARGWWVMGATAVVVSQAVIFTSWSDASAGSVANALVLVAVVYGWASEGPRSLRADYRRRTAAALDGLAPTAAVTEADLGELPAPVAHYVRRTGAVGQPRVSAFRARIHGRIRSGPAHSWMPFTGEQVNTYGADPSRYFLLDATRSGLPVDVLHVVTGGAATMRVRLCSLVPLVDAAGADLDQAETVTLFNDLCVLAPAALVDAPVEWTLLDDHRVSGCFRNGHHTATAELRFDDEGDLIDFVSGDRLRASDDGRAFTRQLWSTPVGDITAFGSRRVPATGEGRWHAPAPEGDFAYLEFHLDDIDYRPAG